MCIMHNDNTTVYSIVCMVEQMINNGKSTGQIYQAVDGKYSIVANDDLEVPVHPFIVPLLSDAKHVFDVGMASRLFLNVPKRIYDAIEVRNMISVLSNQERLYVVGKKIDKEQYLVECIPYSSQHKSDIGCNEGLVCSRSLHQNVFR
jgi:hypothetical protein